MRVRMMRKRVDKRKTKEQNTNLAAQRGKISEK